MKVGLPTPRLPEPVLDRRDVVLADLGHDASHVVRIAAEEPAEHAFDQRQQPRPVLHGETEQAEEDLGGQDHRELDGEVAAASGDHLVEQLPASLASERLDALHASGSEPGVQHVTELAVLVAVEVLGQESRLGLGIAERAEDVAGEHVGALQRLTDVLVAAEHPEALGHGVPHERCQLAHLVETLVVREGRPLSPVVDVDDRAHRLCAIAHGRSVHGSPPRCAD